MLIKEIVENKKRFLRLLLLADEQESMIDRYLDRGRMFVLTDGGSVKTLCVVTDEGDGVLEIKNLVTDPKFQRKGYGRYLIEFIADKFERQFKCLQVGTGDSPATIPFYEKCGFERSHVIKNFFTQNYDHPIYDGGVLLIDMICLRRNLSN